MHKFEIRKFAVSSLGAVLLSGTCVLAAVAPVRAANAPLTTADWQRVVSARLTSGADPMARKVASGEVAETVLAIRFDAAGDYLGAAVVRSSGNAALDRHAVAIADKVAYPPLPAGYRGKPQTVTLRLVLGARPDVDRHVDGTAALETASRFPARDARVAAK